MTLETSDPSIQSMQSVAEVRRVCAHRPLTCRQKRCGRLQDVDITLARMAEARRIDKEHASSGEDEFI